VEGCPVLLVHGFASSAEHNWRQPGWLDLLDDAGRETIAVDLLGHGRAPRPTSPADYESVEARVAADIAGYELVDAVGFSAGAHVLLRLAAAEPERFRRLALLGIGHSALAGSGPAGNGPAGGGPAGNGPAGNGPAGAGLAGAGLAGAGLAGAGAGSIIAALEGEPDPEDVHGMVFRRLADGLGNDRAALVAFLRRPSRPLTGDDLARISCPVLVVLGDKDPAGPGEPLVAALPDARLVTLRGADHFGTPSDVRCMQAVLGFLDG
jgi:pimeloyl-ACP methyl ester carboxylesterase